MNPVFVCKHTPSEPPGELAIALERAGLPVVLCRASAPDAPAFDASAASGLVVLGGPMGACDDAAFPFLARETTWLAEAVGRRLPVLGICLGAQLLARALGACVYRNPSPEVGWADVSVTPEGETDPLLRHLAPAATVFHWHQDTFDLPAGAVHLALSAACRHQAFRFGEHAYGLQFHPEVNAAVLDDWLPELPEATASVTRKQTARHLQEMTDRCGRLFAAWAAICREVNGAPPAV